MLQLGARLFSMCHSESAQAVKAQCAAHLQQRLDAACDVQQQLVRWGRCLLLLLRLLLRL
jgi:hypothetical protein